MKRLLVLLLLLFTPLVAEAQTIEDARPCDANQLKSLEAKAAIEGRRVWHIATLGADPQLDPTQFPDRSEATIRQIYAGTHPASATVYQGWARSLGRNLTDEEIKRIMSSRIKEIWIQCGDLLDTMTSASDVERYIYAGFSFRMSVTEEVGGYHFGLVPFCGNSAIPHLRIPFETAVTTPVTRPIITRETIKTAVEKTAPPDEKKEEPVKISKGHGKRNALIGLGIAIGAAFVINELSSNPATPGKFGGPGGRPR